MQLAKCLGANEIWVVTYTKDALYQGSVLHDALGDAASKALLKGPVSSGGLILQHYTDRTVPLYNARGAVVLVVFPSKGLLDKLDGIM